ncbi:hypothetical protein RB620_02535 [Paenibacillus sp. LHD-117]|uniref:hypothetical protein n=1 Tax=Paenibacillus sp. LHD-117 TaxID=3071412 RepID=UPI0027E1CE95|nr:hypothetical protein [Paenibacillus sp. LHD-117]MDQ6418306.1 hypothetical protein [Paenibacillus sp. LHD-117]
MTTKRQPPNEGLSSCVFQVEILIEDSHHAVALEKLIRGLNAGGFDDYRIASGIRLGELIDQKKSSGVETSAIPIPSPQANTPASSASNASDSGSFSQIRTFMKTNKLIRLIVNRGLGIKLSIPCRIINIDEAEHLITVYHVDEKQVYTFRLNEIEDFLE